MDCFYGSKNLDGTPVNASELRAGIQAMLDEGIEVVPMCDKSECPDFHPVTGCPGHHVDMEQEAQSEDTKKVLR
jgi:hypothetical protein